MPERPTYARWLWLGLAALLLAVAVISYRRAIAPAYDFHHFYRDARYVWEHGTLNPELAGANAEHRRQLPFYLPVVAVLLAPLTAFGLKPGRPGTWYRYCTP
jgi:hypothetical protein